MDQAALTVQPACPRWPSSHGRRGVDRDRLLAVRRAAWPLRRALVRSPTFSDALSGLALIESELIPLAERLADVIYAQVPHAAGAERGRLLALKRAAFNHQPLPEDYRDLADGCLSPIASETHRYQALVLARQRLSGWNREAVLGELREALAERIGATDFRLALEASSPALAAVLRRRESAVAPFSARACRGFYAYVCRFAAKANPLHVFTHLIPGPGMHVAATDAMHPVTVDARVCEVVFSVDAILAIERRLLALGMDAHRVRLAPRPLFRRDGRWQVLLRRGETWCAAFLPDLAVLGHLRSLYDERRDATVAANFTREELERALIERMRGCGDVAGTGDMAAAVDTASDTTVIAVDTAIDRLIALGVLEPYAIDDLWAPVKNLRGVDAADASTERLIACVERWHLARVDVRQLPDIDRELAAAREDCPELLPDGLSYHVNSYADDRLHEAEQAVREIAEPLRELRPLLTVESSFSPHERVIRGFFADEVGEGGARPYLDLLATYLRRKDEILKQLRPVSEAREYDAVARRCQARHGPLDRTDIRELTALCASSPDAPVCAVGPFDFATRRFFLSNVFAGDRMSVTRYLLGRRRQPMTTLEPAADADAHAAPLDVELAVPPDNNLNFVVRCCDVGCGFDRRWAHGYREWIEPTEIEIHVEQGRPTYVHARTGRHLRFRFPGLLAARFLPIEYQLLLIDHAGSYRNPFVAESPGAAPSESGQSSIAVEYRPGLSFGPVCLRRESWVVPARTLRQIVSGGDVLSATAALHRFVRERLAPHDLWFYHFTGLTGRLRKPRLLDIESPLSTMVLRHALTHRVRHVSLSPMDPQWEGLWQTGGEGHVAELMVEA